MHKPQDFLGAAGILNSAMVVVTILKINIGFFGYLKYGDAIRDSISLNLPAEDV